MRNGKRNCRIAGVGLLLASVAGMLACQLTLLPQGAESAYAQDAGQGSGTAPSSSAAQQNASQQNAPGLIIENDSDLPDTFPRASYEMRFRAHGGISVLHWKLEKGALPPGIKLEDDGLLHGSPERSGEFQFTVSVTDGNHQQGVQKGFVLRVRSALSLEWKTAAHVTGNRIDGTVDVSNTTPDDMDLTFYVLAVAENGRATAIGYQHFVLKRGTLTKELPFGETLPHGGYVIHVDAVGEVAAKNVIYRESLQTPAALQITVSP